MAKLLNKRLQNKLLQIVVAVVLLLSLLVVSVVIFFQASHHNNNTSMDKSIFQDVYESAGLAKNPKSFGASWADYDNDGYLDLLITGSPTTLYKNLGNESFEDVTKEAGLDRTHTTSGLFADYDNDGCLDLFLNLRIIDSSALFYMLLHNNCNGGFEDMTKGSGLDTLTNASTYGGIAAADYDNDGYIDLYTAGHGRYETKGIYILIYEPNHLFHNNGDGTFTDVTEKAGVSGLTDCVPPRFKFAHIVGTEGGPIKAALQPFWFDYNDDGKIDLFVATDVGVSPLYTNNGDGTFKEVTSEAGLCVYGSNMGVTAGDLDNNGALDLYTTNVGTNYLWMNQGNGKFWEVAKQIDVSDPLSIGWGTSFLDFDNDGRLDLYVTNGTIIVTDPENLGVGKEKKDKLYQNLGTTLSDVSLATGISGDDPKYGSAIADYNNDGFVDIIVLGQPTVDSDFNRLYRNSGNVNNWLTIKLVGTKSNRDGIGAKIIVTARNGRQIKQVSAGESYLSQNSLWQTFGLGKSNKVDKIEIKWPSGIIQKIQDVKPNQIITITER
jgi:hypothetical protein